MSDTQAAMREFRFLDEKRKTNGLTPIEDQRWQELAATLGIDLSQQVPPQPQGAYGPDGQWYPYAPQGYDPQVWGGAPGAWQGYYPPQPQGYYGPDGQWYQYPPQPQGYYGPDGQWYQYPPQGYGPPGYAQPQGYYGPDGQWVPAPMPPPQPQWDPQTQQWVQPGWQPPPQQPEAPAAEQAWQAPSLDAVSETSADEQAAREAEPAPIDAAPTPTEDQPASPAEVESDEVMEIGDEEVVEIPPAAPSRPEVALAPPPESLDPVADLRNALSFDDDEPSVPASSPMAAFHAQTAVTTPAYQPPSLAEVRKTEAARSSLVADSTLKAPATIALLELPPIEAEAPALLPEVVPEPTRQPMAELSEPAFDAIEVETTAEPVVAAVAEPTFDVVEPAPAVVEAMVDVEPLPAVVEPEPQPEPVIAAAEPEPAPAVATGVSPVSLLADIADLPDLGELAAPVAAQAPEPEPQPEPEPEPVLAPMLRELAAEAAPEPMLPEVAAAAEPEAPSPETTQPLFSVESTPPEPQRVERTTLPVIELGSFDVEATASHPRLDASRTTTPVEVPAFDAPPLENVQPATPLEASPAFVTELRPRPTLVPPLVDEGPAEFEVEGPRERTQVVPIPLEEPVDDSLEALPHEPTMIVPVPRAPEPMVTPTTSAFDELALPPDAAPIPTFSEQPSSKPTAPNAQAFPSWDDVPEPVSATTLSPMPAQSSASSPFGGGWSNDDAVEISTPPEGRIHAVPKREPPVAEPPPVGVAKPDEVGPGTGRRALPRITAEEAWPPDTSSRPTQPRVPHSAPVPTEWDDISIDSEPVEAVVVPAAPEPSIIVDLGPEEKIELAQTADFIGDWKQGEAAAVTGPELEIEADLGSFEVESESVAALATGTSQSTGDFSGEKLELASNADFLDNPQLTQTGEAWKSSPSSIEVEGEVLVGEVIHGEIEQPNESWGTAVSDPSPVPQPPVRAQPQPQPQPLPPAPLPPARPVTLPRAVEVAVPPLASAPTAQPPVVFSASQAAAVAGGRLAPAPAPVPLGEGPLTPSGSFRGPVNPAPFDRSGGPVGKTADQPVQVKGSHRVILHTLEGGVKRGSLHDADLTSAMISLETAPGAVERVPRERVKAIFFMLAPGSRSPSPDGAKVRVTFLDGRQVAGFSADHTMLPAGFFVVPADNRTNTERIFIYRHSISTVAVEG